MKSIIFTKSWLSRRSFTSLWCNLYMYSFTNQKKRNANISTGLLFFFLISQCTVRNASAIVLDYYVVGKRESNVKCIYNKTKIERRRRRKNIAEERSFCIPFVDRCCRWYERITLVCILCARALPTARTHTNTHVFTMLLLLIFAFFHYDSAITLMCLFCVFSAWNGACCKDDCVGCKNAYWCIG